MKNTILLIVVTVVLNGFMSPALYGQQFYAGFNAGYGLKIPSPRHNTWYTSNANINTISTFETIKFSLGQGINIGLNGGCKISENTSVELNVSYLSGAPINTYYTDTDTASNYYFHMETSTEAKMIYLNPAILISLSSEKQLNPYIKFGILYGVGKVHETNGMMYSGEYYDQNIVYSNGHALGFSSSLGITYKASDLIDIFCEAKINAISYTPGKSELTKSTRDGVDQLPSLTLYGKETIYVNSYTFDQNAPIDASKPQEALKDQIPLNSAGFHIGLRFNL